MTETSMGPVELAPTWPWLVVGREYHHVGVTSRECGCWAAAGVRERPEFGSAVCEDGD